MTRRWAPRPLGINWNIGYGGAVLGGAANAPAVRLTGNTLAENSAAGTAIGTLSTVNTTGTAVFTLTDSAGAKIALTGTNDTSVVAGATPVDFETTPTFNFSVSVTGTTPPIPGGGTLGVIVTDVFEAPAPNAPVLAMDPAWVTTDATPDFTIDIDDTIGAGDDLQLQIQIAGGDWSSPVEDTTHVITAPEDTANEIDLALGSLVNDDYEARARVDDGTPSAWSNEVAFTVAAVATGYEGPGDIVSGAIMWVSPARAYSAAFAATAGPIMDLVDAATGLVTTTINILPTGFVDVAAIPGSAQKVKKLYDQTGNGNHVTQATLLAMPVLTLSALNGLPCLTTDGGASNQFLVTAGNITATQPYTFSIVHNATNNTGGGVFGGAGGTSASMTAGNTVIGLGAVSIAFSGAASINNFHAVQGMSASGASNSVVNVDGTETTGTHSSVLTAVAVRVCRNGSGGTSFIGKIMEAGLWNTTGFDGTQRTNMNANQHHVTYGYNF